MKNQAFQSIKEMWDELAKHEQSIGVKPTVNDMRRWSTALTELDLTLKDQEEEIARLKEDQEKMMRLIKAINNNIQIEGMVGFNEWCIAMTAIAIKNHNVT